jgi:4-hydroxybenzoate polyprenyltransferase
MGILAILSAIKYTIGKGAFAYNGTGDLIVFAFFGPVSVCGIYFLHSQGISIEAILAGAALGFFSTSVLNVNNLRDLDTDKSNGKRTIPVRLGPKKALLYHRFLCWAGFLSIIFSIYYHLYQEIAEVSKLEYILLFGVFSPVIIILSGHISRLSLLLSKDIVEDESDVSTETELEIRSKFNAELKTLSLSTLVTSFIYFIIIFLYV